VAAYGVNLLCGRLFCVADDSMVALQMAAIAVGLLAGGTVPSRKKKSSCLIALGLLLLCASFYGLVDLFWALTPFATAHCVIILLYWAGTRRRTRKLILPADTGLLVTFAVNLFADRGVSQPAAVLIVTDSGGIDCGVDGVANNEELLAHCLLPLPGRRGQGPGRLGMTFSLSFWRGAVFTLLCCL